MEEKKPTMMSASAKPTMMSASARKCAMPESLLKLFKNDVRRVPEIPHANGWIIFDHEMLISVLRNDNPKIRNELANQIEKMNRANGMLISVQR